MKTYNLPLDILLIGHSGYDQFSAAAFNLYRVKISRVAVSHEDTEFAYQLYGETEYKTSKLFCRKFNIFANGFFAGLQSVGVSQYRFNS